MVKSQKRSQISAELTKLELSHGSHSWLGTFKNKTWVATFKEPICCSECENNIERGDIFFLTAKRKPNTVSYSKNPKVICEKCYAGERPGTVAIYEVENKNEE